MSQCKVVELRSSPKEIVDLSFSQSGMITYRSPASEIGNFVKKFDLKKDASIDDLHEVGRPPSAPTPVPEFVKTSHWARYKWDSASLKFKLVDGNRALFAIQNSDLQSELDRAIAMRANAYVSKYGQIDATVYLHNKQFGEPSVPTGVYPPANGQWSMTAETDGKRLERLRKITKSLEYIWNQLKSAYSGTTIIRSALSVTRPEGKHTAENYNYPLGTKSSTGTDVTTHEPTHFRTTGNPGWEDTKSKVISSETTTNYGTGHAFKSITETDLPSIRVPLSEVDKEYETALMGIDDEVLRTEIERLQNPYRRTILENESQAIDSNVRRLQEQFMQTFLLSPTNGRISAVFKQPGEFVRAGEPVLRMENDDLCLFGAKVIHDGIIRIGNVMKVTTSQMCGLNQVLTFDARVVAISKNDGKSNEWSLVLECANPKSTSNENQIPPWYNFDCDALVASIQ